MAKDLEEWEIFYEEVGTSNEAADVDYEEEYEESVEPAAGLNEEDVYKLSQDQQDEPMQFEEQIDPNGSTE